MNLERQLPDGIIVNDHEQLPLRLSFTIPGLTLSNA